MPRTISERFDDLAAGLRDAERRAATTDELERESRSAVVRGARLVLAAAERGEPWVSSGIAVFANLAGTKSADSGPDADSSYLTFWSMFVTPWVRSARPADMRALPGEYEHPHPMLDGDNRPLCTSGKPAVGRWFRGTKRLPATFDINDVPRNERCGYAWRLEGELAHVEDDFDDARKFENVRARVVRWADCLESLAELSASRQAAAMQPGPDYASMTWGREQFEFAKGQQAAAVKALFEAFPHPLTQESIGDAVASVATRFELRKLFANHPAWGTMIRQATKGSYKIVSPESA